MKLPSLTTLLKSVSDTSIRFPFAILFCVGVCCTAMYLIEYEPARTESMIFKFMTMMVIGVPLMIGIQSLTEQNFEQATRRWLFYLFGAAILALYLIFIAPDFNVIEMVRPTRFISLLVVAHLFVAVAPYLKFGQISDFWEYNKNIFIIWIAGALYSLIIFTGLSVAILSVDQLFGVNVDSKLYGHVFVLVATIFHPIYFMSNYPKTFHQISQDEHFASLILNLVKFILIPLSILYISILYLYGAKIAIEWSLPKGWVSSLVIGFSIVGMLTYLLNYRLPETDKNGLIVWFRKRFFYLLSPLVILLYIAIVKRLNEYGFTPERYFVLITGLWLSFISIYFILSKKDDIKWIPLSLIAFLAIGTYSPIDAFHVSSKSQVKRLEGIFVKNKLFRDGKFIRDTANVFNAEDHENTLSIIQMLHEINALNILNEKLSVPVAEDSLQSEKGVGIIYKTLGIQNAENYFKSNVIYNLYSDIYRPDDISGFQKMLKTDVYKGDSKENGLMLKPDRKSIVWMRNNEVIATLEMKDIPKTLVEKYGNNGQNLDPKELSLNFENQDYHMKLCIHQLGIEQNNGEYLINNLEGFFLYSPKD